MSEWPQDLRAACELLPALWETRGGRMSEFRWHLMADEKPEYGERDYLVMGHKGGFQLAKGYKKSRVWDGMYFYCTKGDRGRKRIEAKDVRAWAEIPPLEASE